MELLIVLLWVSAFWVTFGALASIAMIGKAREPLTPGVAVFSVITSAIIVGALVSAALFIVGVAS